MGYFKYCDVKFTLKFNDTSCNVSNIVMRSLIYLKRHIEYRDEEPHTFKKIY